MLQVRMHVNEFLLTGYDAAFREIMENRKLCNDLQKKRPGTPGAAIAESLQKLLAEVDGALAIPSGCYCRCEEPGRGSWFSARGRIP